MDYEEIEVDIPEKNRILSRLSDKINETKKNIAENKEKVFLFLQFCLVAASFFGIGLLYGDYRLSGAKDLKIGQNEQILGSLPAIFTDDEQRSTESQNTTPKRVEETDQKNTRNTEKKPVNISEFPYIASKNGSTYYKVTCSNRISDKNKIYFKTEEDAQKTGLRRSKTCFK